MQRDGYVALAAPDDGSLEAELKVVGRAQGKHLRVHPGVVRKGVALERADEEVIAQSAEEVAEVGDVHRLDAVDAERVDVFGVVAPGHGTAGGRSLPGIGFAGRDLVPGDVEGECSFLQPERVRGGDGTVRNGVLRLVGRGEGNGVVARKQ